MKAKAARDCTKRWAFGPTVRMAVGTPISLPELLGLSPNSSFLITCMLGSSSWWTSWVPGDAGRAPRSWLQGGPSLVHSRHLGSESISGWEILFTSLCLVSLLQANKFKKTPQENYRSISPMNTGVLQRSSKSSLKMCARKKIMCGFQFFYNKLWQTFNSTFHKLLKAPLCIYLTKGCYSRSGTLPIQYKERMWLN